MRVISRTRLRQFWESPVGKRAENPLRAWFSHVNHHSTNWNNWGDVRKCFNSADKVGDCVVFNIAGNKYRLVTRIRYVTKKVFILKIMTHGQYDENKWPAECGCFSRPL